MLKQLRHSNGPFMLTDARYILKFTNDNSEVTFD